MGEVILLEEHRYADAPSSIGYKSGLSSWRETPEARSTSNTRSGGTSSHCATACLVTPKDVASFVSPPAALMARSRAEFDMEAMSSTASQESQAPLHLHRQAELYHLDMTLGKKIEKARKAKKWTLQKLADEVGVSRQLVWQWERGDSDARVHIGALAKALEMPVEYFHGITKAPETLEAKIKLLTPQNRDFISTMADQFLAQQEAEIAAPPKKA